MIVENGSKCMKKIEKMSNLKIGEKGKIVALNITNKVIKRHLLDMGLVRGTIVGVKNTAPMGDPVTLTLRSYELCVGKADLSQIEVEVV